MNLLPILMTLDQIRGDKEDRYSDEDEAADYQVFSLHAQPLFE